MDTELFIVGKRSRELKIQDAQVVCATCPVRAPCLKSALLTGDEYGIMALSPMERSMLSLQERERLLTEVTIARRR